MRDPLIFLIFKHHLMYVSYLLACNQTNLATNTFTFYIRYTYIALLVLFSLQIQHCILFGYLCNPVDSYGCMLCTDGFSFMGHTYNWGRNRGTPKELPK